MTDDINARFRPIPAITWTVRNRTTPSAERPFLPFAMCLPFLKAALSTDHAAEE
jgi:hypothetical protein